MYSKWQNRYIFKYVLQQTRTIEVQGITEQSIVPAPGDIVTAIVTLVNQRFCKCSIKCVGDIVLTRPYRGILRKEDVRAIDKDRLEMYKCYRPGDIILARVVSFKFILENIIYQDYSCCFFPIFLDRCQWQKHILINWVLRKMS